MADFRKISILVDTTRSPDGCKGNNGKRNPPKSLLATPRRNSPQGTGVPPFLRELNAPRQAFDPILSNGRLILFFFRSSACWKNAEPKVGET
jgi:hypothetical protein